MESDCAPLNGLCRCHVGCHHQYSRFADDQGGLASSLNEIAKMSGVGIAYDERNLPVPDVVRSACDMLGLDPIYVANEGKLLAIAPATVADGLLAAMPSSIRWATKAKIVAK
ncbi:MAG: AIR synthase-related protein [Caldilineaceae bacterium]